MKKRIEDLICRVLRALGAGDKLVQLAIQVFRFLLVGGTVFLVDFVLMMLLKEAFGLHPMWATAISFILSNILNYFLSVRFVFPTDESRGRAALVTVFLLLAAVGLGLNQLIMWLMNDRLGVDYRLAKIVSAAVVAVYNFITRKLFLERKEED